MAALDERRIVESQVTTQMSTKRHRFRWTVKIFSKLPNERFTSPDIKAIPPYVWHLGFQRSYSDLHVYIASEISDEFKMKCQLSFYELNDNCLYQFKQIEALVNKQWRNLLSIDILERLENLKDDTLIIVCDFEINEITTGMTEIWEQRSTLQKYAGQKKLLADMKVLFDNHHHHPDMTLIVDENQLPCHKSILCVRSPVFEKMFQHQMNEQDQNEVHVDDVKFSTLKKLIDFLYCGIVDAEEDTESAYALYYAADKYEVLDLQKMCAETLLSKCTLDNATQVLIWADRHRDSELKSYVLNFISKNFHLIIESQVWESFVESEIKLAAQVMKYCSQNAKILIC